MKLWLGGQMPEQNCLALNLGSATHKPFFLSVFSPTKLWS